MKAWQVNARGEPAQVMTLAETTLEPPGAGELHIRVAASALALPDVLMCRGTYPLTPKLPFTPGQEFVGTVIAVGSGVATPVGSRVMGVSAFMIGRGAFAQECKTYERMIFPAAAAIDDTSAAGFTIAYHTAYIALVRRARLTAGETLLVHGGAGGTGSAAIQLGKSLGARVIATASSADKLAFCRELGADHVIDYARENFAGAVMKATQGHGADVVFDPVGGATFEKSLNCVAHEGRLLPIGFASGRWGAIPPELLAFKNASVIGAMPNGFSREFMLSMHEQLLKLFADGAIRVVVETIGFDQIGTALQQLAERQVRGRIVARH